VRLTAFLVLILTLAAPGQVQDRPTTRSPVRRPNPPASEKGAEFTFVRAIFRSPLSGWRRGSWATDFPEADYHFIAGIRFWSGATLRISPTPVQMRIMDDKLFQYPLIYFVEPGYMEMSQEEAERLREYTRRGGFLFLDDFWGDYEWDVVRRQLREVFPKLPVEDLPLTHAVFHNYFDIDEVVQVPGIGSWLRRGVTHEKGGIIPHYMGVHDESGRLVAFVARNCDLGDAWEWINDPSYPLKYGLAAYRLGINVVTYAMTH
jgi:hypothetical protein